MRLNDVRRFSSTPAGVPAISRGLSEAIPPDLRRTNRTPEGCQPPSRQRTSASTAVRKEDEQSKRGLPPVWLRPLRGRIPNCATGHQGRRSAQPLANGCDPSGVEKMASTDRRSVERGGLFHVD